MPVTSGPRSPPPSRGTSGVTTDPKYGPLADCGYGSPFFYHGFADDFDNALGATGLYTVTPAASAVHTPGDGGIATLTTAAAASSNSQIQLPAASVTLPGTGAAPPGTSLSTKKLFYESRITLGHSTDALIFGLCNTGTTPFTAGVDSLTDGLYFSKALGTQTISLVNRASAANSPTGSAVLNSFVIPGITLVAGTSLDFAFAIDAFQNIQVWIAAQLVGYFPQSGSGGVRTDNSGLSTLPQLGPIFANYNFQAQFANNFISTFQNPIVFSTANLNLTIAVSNGTTAAATTAIADFHMFAKER